MFARTLPRLSWPLPALLAWLAAWAAFAASGSALLAGALGALAALAVQGGWRRAWVAAGFPLSALALGAAPAVPAWAWGAAALPLLLAYPVRAWRDAPFFPTPRSALAGLDAMLALPAGARVLDAGCGAGDGLRALRRVWPAAVLEGVEWSRPLACLAARRCRDARVCRADMWAHSWAPYALVYLFQRPESMPRAWAKALREMAPGSVVASLEFEIPDATALARLGGAGRALWLYRVPPSLHSIGGATRR